MTTEIEKLDWKDVTSSQIKAIAHDNGDGTGPGVLYVKFQNESIYSYAEAPLTVFEALMAEEAAGGSVGKYFNAHVKNNYTFTRVA